MSDPDKKILKLPDGELPIYDKNPELPGYMVCVWKDGKKMLEEWGATWIEVDADLTEDDAVQIKVGGGKETEVRRFHTGMAH